MATVAKDRPDPKDRPARTVRPELFRAVTNERAIGEASDWYLSSTEAPERIHKYIPNARLIAVLRQPADRAFSSYMHFARNGFVPVTFE